MPIATPISLITHHDEHWYRIEEAGETHFIPSVTTKLGIIDKPFLARWRGDIGNREADLRSNESSQRGKRIHWAYETFLKGGAVVYNSWKKPIYSGEQLEELERKHGSLFQLKNEDEMHDIVKLKKEHEILNPEVLHVEVKVFDIAQRDAGTIDNAVFIKEGVYPIAGSIPLRLEGGIYIRDLKTGGFIDDKVWLQMAPYAYMYEKIYGEKIKGALIQHTGASSIKKGIPGYKCTFRSREDLLTYDLKHYRHASELWLRDHQNDRPQEYEVPTLIHKTIKLGEPL